MPAPSPILSAVYKGDRATLEQLLGVRSPDGWPPLHIAAFHDDVAIVNTLLAHGAAAEARDDDGKTPLAIAEEQGRALVARRLRGEMP
jgi:ankyrin repeat protein